MNNSTNNFKVSNKALIALAIILSLLAVGLTYYIVDKNIMIGGIICE